MKKGMVFGAGISGLGAENTLKKMGYQVILVDDKVAISSDIATKILANEEIDIFIKSPGVPYTELVEKALEKNIDVIDDIELAYRYKISNNISGKIIAITGTNGKTTVTSKIKELLEEGGYKAEVCGNIGKSFSEVVSNGSEIDYYILEASSYQLENLKEFKADISLLINLAPDHLSRYVSIDNYYDTKINIGKNQTSNEKFIINSGCKESMKRINRISGEKIFVGANRTSNEELVYSKNGIIFYEEEVVLDSREASLKGEHNLENMLFIVAVGKIVGISSEIIKNFLYKTKTLEHRMENFYKYGEIEFINDSKGTNIDSTAFAVKAFENPILISGGFDKKLDLSSMATLIKDNVKEVYLIGEIADKIDDELKKIGYSESKIFNLKTLDKVLEKIKERILKTEKNIILFSPGTSSFDQFKNFEDRGNNFKKLVKEIFN